MISEFPSEKEFQAELKERMMLQSFLNSYKGDGKDVKAAWDTFKLNPQLADVASNRQIGFDGERLEHGRGYPTKGICPRSNTDELIKASQRILEIHRLLEGFETPPNFTVPDKFLFHRGPDARALLSVEVSRG